MGVTRDAVGRRKLAIGLILTFIVGSIAILAPARAEHPTGTCLDVELETAQNPVGSLHTLTATLRVAGPTSCTATAAPAGSNQAATGVRVRFDVEGGPIVTVIDEQNNNERTRPRQASPADLTGDTNWDMTCTMAMTTNSCQVSFRGEGSGLNRIRGWIAGHGPDENEPRDETAEQPSASNSGAGDEPDTTDVVEKLWAGPPSRIECDPETDNNPTGSSHTVTCTVTDANGHPVPGEEVNAEATGANDTDGDTPTSPDYTCTSNTNAQGQCSFTHPSGSSSNPGTTTYRAFVDKDKNDANNASEVDASEGQNESTSPGPTEPDTTDVVTKTWVVAPLNCDPETDVNPSGTVHRILCTARDVNGQLAAGVNIDAEATGANDPDLEDTTTGDENSPQSGLASHGPDFTCTTDANGQCEIVHGPGGNAIENPARSNDSNATNSAGTTTYRIWIDTDNNNATFNGDAAEGRDETTEPGSQSEPEADRTDVVEKTWTASNVDCNPETDRNPTGTAHSVTCQATDENNAIVAGIEIDVEAAGANDPDGTESFDTPDWTCITTGQGLCTIVHGPGGTGTTVNAGTTVYSGWVDLDRSNTTQELDADEGRVEGVDLREPDNTDVVEKIWIAARLDCAPEADTNPAQTAHTITCTATDTSGAPQAGINVDAEATGPNDPDNANSLTTPDFSCTTGTNGQCSFIHGPGGRGTTNGFGRTLYRVWIDQDNNDATTEADGTEGRDEGPAVSGSPSPTPTSSPSPSPAQTVGAAQNTSQRVVAQQQSPSPTPTQGGGGGSPSPAPTQGGGGSSPTPSGPPATPVPGGTPAPSGPGQRAEPDDTDVVEKNWSAVPTRLEITPETDSAPVGSCNAFTITARDASGNPVASVVVDVEQRHERSDNATANDEPTVSFCTPAETDGTNPSSVDPTRGDLGTGSDGSIGGETDRTTDAQGKVTIGIQVAPGQGSNGTGNVLVTVFYENEDNDDPDTADPQDTATKTWVPSQARTVDCEPESAENSLGTEHTVTCTVRNSTGGPAPGEGVTFSEDGPGHFTTGTQRTTDSSGQVTATVTSDESGTQTITGTITASTQGEPDTDACERPANDPQGAPAGSCSDSVQKTWAQGRRVTSGPCKNFFEGSRTERAGGGRVIVGTPGNDTLRGTRGDDIICGLGGRDTLIGADGNDLVVGGGGNDIARGNAGRDTLRGNAGRDTLAGGSEKDRLIGNGDADVLRAGGANDVLKGGGGKDALKGRGGKDRLLGGKSNDKLNGGPGSDFLDGGPGQDSCVSGGGSDTFNRCE